MGNNKKRLERMCNDTRIKEISLRLVGSRTDIARGKLTCNGQGYYVGNQQFPTCAVLSVSSDIIYLDKRYLHMK